MSKNKTKKHAKGNGPAVSLGKVKRQKRGQQNTVTTHHQNIKQIKNDQRTKLALKGNGLAKTIKKPLLPFNPQKLKLLFQTSAVKISAKCEQKASELLSQNSTIEKGKLDAQKGNRGAVALGNAVTKLKAAQFRFINEKLYTCSGSEALRYFDVEPSAFEDYHRGYHQQVIKWPTNPLDLIIKDLEECPEDHVIADFGCGEAKIAQTFPKRKVHSFDLKALNDHVIECDISKVPLENDSVDVAVFCLSLMGTNFTDYLVEASRVLKPKGILYIAEVKSRFEKPDEFLSSLKAFGFSLLHQDWSDKMFGFLKLQANRLKFRKKCLSSISLTPCLYKKR